MRPEAGIELRRLFVGTVVVGIDGGVVRPSLRYIGVGVNGLDGASRYARSTVNTYFGVDVELRVVVSPVNTVDGTHIDTRTVLGSDARFGDNVWHGYL
jgi:hypothetical protein